MKLWDNPIQTAQCTDRDHILLFMCMRSAGLSFTFCSFPENSYLFPRRIQAWKNIYLKGFSGKPASQGPWQHFTVPQLSLLDMQRQLLPTNTTLEMSGGFQCHGSMLISTSLIKAKKWQSPAINIHSGILQLHQHFSFYSPYYVCRGDLETSTKCKINFTIFSPCGWKRSPKPTNFKNLIPT